MEDHYPLVYNALESILSLLPVVLVTPSLSPCDVHPNGPLRDIFFALAIFCQSGQRTALKLKNGSTCVSQPVMSRHTMLLRGLPEKVDS